MLAEALNFVSQNPAISVVYFVIAYLFMWAVLPASVFFWLSVGLEVFLIFAAGFIICLMIAMHKLREVN